MTQSITHHSPHDTQLTVVNLVDHLVLPDQLPAVKEIRVASYNVRNLFGETPDAWTQRPSDPIEPERQRALINVLKEIEADVVAFQEVQNEVAFTSLFRGRSGVNAALDQDRRFSAFVCVPARDPRGINVALATRLSVRATLTFHDREFTGQGHDGDEKVMRFSRDLLGVELNARKDYRFLMFVGHLKSQIGGDTAELKRRAEASEVARIMTEPVFGGNQFIDQDVLFAGDMNTEANSETIGILRGLKSPLLTDLFENVEETTYPTALVKRKYPPQRLDFIFASPSMAPRARDPRVHQSDAANEASDHFPIYLDLDVRPE